VKDILLAWMIAMLVCLGLLALLELLALYR